MTFITVWSADWQHCEQFPAPVVQQLLDEGFVHVGWKPNRSGRKLRLAYFAKELFHKIRDLSAQMGAWMTEAAADGSTHHREIAKTWRGCNYTEPVCAMRANLC